jgi:hypothetical protein
LGAFALISVASGRPPWTLLPAIAMLAYGWTFYSGFLNFYLSVGFAFWAVALLWRGNRTDFSAAIVLAFLALLAPDGLVGVGRSRDLPALIGRLARLASLASFLFLDSSSCSASITMYFICKPFFGTPGKTSCS